MNNFAAVRHVLACTALCALAACSQSAGTSSTTTTDKSASSGSPSSSEWISNGATACEKYLTLDVVATIWADSAGQSKAFTTGSAHAQACVYQSAHSGNNIRIALNTDGPESFDAG